MSKTLTCWMVCSHPLRSSLFPFLLSLLLFPGCGSSYDSTISGKVMMNGSPLSKGTVSFHPVAGGPVATGAIQSDGTFTIQTATKEGLQPGEYKVTVVATDPPPPGDDENPGTLLTAPEFGRIDSTPLSFTVEAGANEFEFSVDPAPAS